MKFSNEQLGEIGAEAASGSQKYHWLCIDPEIENGLCYAESAAKRTAFAAAVASAVRKETPWGANGETREDWMARETQKKFEELLAKKLEWLSGCEKGDGEMFSDQSDAEMAEHLRQLRLHVASAWHAVIHASALRLELLATLRAENAKQAEEIARLSWRPVSVKPTRDDADPSGSVEVLGSSGERWFSRLGSLGIIINPDSSARFWRPFYPPPAPTAEQQEREEREAAYQASLKETWRDVSQWNSKEAFEKGWQARAKQEATV